MHPRRAKGQFFSEDLLFALVFLIFLLSLYIIVSERISYATGYYTLHAGLSAEAGDAAAQLVETQGVPLVWAQSNINASMSSIGLAGKGGVLSAEKARKFFNITVDSDEYNATKSLLGLDTRLERFNATLEYINGTPIYSLNATPTSLGNAYGEANATAVATRFAVLNSSIVKFTLVVWVE